MSNPNHNVAIRDDRMLTMIAKAMGMTTRICHHFVGRITERGYTEGKARSKKRTRNIEATRNDIPVTRSLSE
jgi:hypothetical protein